MDPWSNLGTYSRPVAAKMPVRSKWSAKMIALVVVGICVVVAGVAVGIYFGVKGSASTPPVPGPADNQDCVVQYSDWSVCSPGCGQGTQTRSGTIVTPQKSKGRACTDLMQTRSCTTACATSMLVNPDQTFSIGPWIQSPDAFTISFWFKLNKIVLPMNLLNTYTSKTGGENAYGAIELRDQTSLRWNSFFSGGNEEFVITNLDFTRPILVTYGWKRYYASPSKVGNMFFAVNDIYHQYDKLVNLPPSAVPNMEFFNTNGASGWIQDARVYSTRLTGEQVKAIYNNGKPDHASLVSEQENLVMQYPLLEGTGSTLQDAVSKKYIIVPDGTITWQSQNVFLL